MGGGVPLSGVIGKAKIMDLPDTGNMSSTHSANPLVCAAGLAVLNEIENKNLIQNTNKKSIILFNGLKELKQKYPDRIEYIFGKGLIAAIFFKEPRTNAPDGYFTSMVAERCIKRLACCSYWPRIYKNRSPINNFRRVRMKALKY